MRKTILHIETIDSLSSKRVKARKGRKGKNNKQRNKKDKKMHPTSSNYHINVQNRRSKKQKRISSLYPGSPRARLF